MSALRQKITEVVRVLGRPPGSGGDQSERLREAERQLEKQRGQLRDQAQEIRDLRARISEGMHGDGYGGIRPEKIVWVFGNARTGSTWLAFMMEGIEGHAVWREPYVGELFGRLYYNWVGEKHFQTKHFILGRHKGSWTRSVRHFVLGEATARFPGVADGGYLIIKEPNGSVGAPLMMEALPESRLIFRLRDPRDVVPSSLVSLQKGSWLYERRVNQGGGRTAMFDVEADAHVERSANSYAQNVGNVREAYENHGGPKVLVRYEDLRADTLGTMKRIYSTLEIPVDEADLVRVIEKYAWENIPEEEKGPGKIRRKASSGGWKEDLTPEQIAIVEEEAAPILDRFYAGDRHLAPE